MEQKKDPELDIIQFFPDKMEFDTIFGFSATILSAVPALIRQPSNPLR